MCAISEFGFPVCDRCGGELDLMDMNGAGSHLSVQGYEGMICENCGKMYCGECLAEMKATEQAHCPDCSGRLVPLTSGNLPQIRF
jgi:DNA-directed RNA polymerase subunit RPC12/RpoP